MSLRLANLFSAISPKKIKIAFTVHYRVTVIHNTYRICMYVCRYKQRTQCNSKVILLNTDKDHKATVAERIIEESTKLLLSLNTDNVGKSKAY